MRFPEALNHIFNGKRMSRSGWNGKGMYVRAQYPDEHSKMTLPYVYMFTACGNVVPWLVSQSDLFANDWGYAD